MRLGDLIHQRKKQLGQTWPGLVENARAAGHPISRATLIEFGKDVIGTSVQDDTLHSIAAAIKVPVHDVYDAIGETKGYTTAGPLVVDDRTHMFALIAEKLPPAQVDRVLQSLAMQVRAYELIEGIDPAGHEVEQAGCTTD